MSSQRQIVRRLLPMLLLSGLAACWTLVGGPAPWAGTSQAQPPDAGSRFPRQIIVIRHGEEENNPNDIHLSSRGKERADRLPQLFVASADRPTPFSTPDFIFAAAGTEKSNRPVETVGPLAAKLHLPINSGYLNNSGERQLAHELLRNPTYAGKTILICWRHKAIPELAYALRARNVPQRWPGHIYDRVWLIRYDAAGNAQFSDLPQHLLPGDSDR